MEENSIVAKPKQWALQVTDFWRDTNSEMRKVTWPNRQEVVSTTAVELVATIVFAVYLWGCDQVFFWLTQKLFMKFGAGT